MPDNTPYPRRIRSYVRREGRMTKGQARALETYQEYQLTSPACSRASLVAQKPSEGYALEIGFGMGDSLATMCAQYPDIVFVGVEVLTKGVGSLLRQVKANQATNLLVHQGDAVELVKQSDTDTFNRVHVFFPDPWHKARHNKRRLLSVAFVAELARVLRVGGVLHIKTDWADYAHAIQAVLDASIDFAHTTDTNAALAIPETRFEKRGKKLGHRVYEFVRVRV